MGGGEIGEGWELAVGFYLGDERRGEVRRVGTWMEWSGVVWEDCNGHW